MSAGMSTPAIATGLPLPPPGGTALPRARAASTGLWFFIGVASALFGLFLAAYVMRLDGAEGYPLTMPWQFWFGTALLAAGSLSLQAAARQGSPALWRLGGFCAAAFVLVQLWAWQALAQAQVLPAGNPAAGFLYLLTAMHGLHVLGGLAAWLLVQRAGAQPWRIALCARYWHFLLLLWLLLFAVMALLTPDIVGAICGRTT